MRFSYAALAAAVVLAPLAAVPAKADVLTTKVYGATLEPGKTEIEARYGRLVGGEAGGEDGLLIELAHHFSSRFYGGIESEFEREDGGKRRLAAVGAEGIFTLGKIGGIDTALLGEYEAVRGGPDVVATKLLLQKKAGELDARLNLAAERELEGGAPIEFGYAASLDTEVAGEFRLGAMATGGLGTTRHLTLNDGHFVGPIAKYEIELGKGELEFNTGYLFAIGRVRDEAKGAFRLQLEYGIEL